MGLLNNDNLDDPLIFDSVPDFSGGMASNRPASALDASQYFLGINVDIKTKLAVTRRGTTSLGALGAGPIQALQWFATPTLAFTVAAVGGSLQKYNEVTWSPIAGYSAASGSGSQIGLAQLINKLYIADSQTDLFSWDGSAMADLGTGAANQPPQGNLILAHTNRLWMAGVAAIPDALYASTAVSITWDTQNLMIRVGSGDGDPITALAPWDNDQIVVFKRNSIYIVQADPIQTGGTSAYPLANASVTKIAETIGCAASRSVVIVGSDIWFLSDSGIRSVRRVIAQTQREVTNAISEPIHDLIQRINWPQASQCAACFWDNKYLLSVPLDTASSPSTVLVFDTLRQAWAGFWTGWTPTAFALSKASGQERLNIGQASGSVLRWLDYVPSDNETDSTFTDSGALIESELWSRGLTFGDGSANTSSRGLVFVDGLSPKSLFNVETVFFQSLAQVTASLVFDQGQELALATQFDSRGGAPLLIPFQLPATLDGQQVRRRVFPGRQFNPFREVQIVVRAPFDKLALRSVSASAFSETILPEQ